MSDPELLIGAAAAALLSLVGATALVSYSRAAIDQLPVAAKADPDVRAATEALDASPFEWILTKETLWWALGATATFVALALLDFDIAFTLMYVAGLGAWFAWSYTARSWEASNARRMRSEGTGPSARSRAWAAGLFLLIWAANASFLAIWAFAAYLVVGG